MITTNSQLRSQLYFSAWRVYLPLGSLHLGAEKVPVARSLLPGTSGREPRNATTSMSRSQCTSPRTSPTSMRVRGLRRNARGEDLEPQISDGRVTLGYRGLDSVVRRTLLQFTPRPAQLDERDSLRPFAPGEQPSSIWPSDAGGNLHPRITGGTSIRPDPPPEKISLPARRRAAESKHLTDNLMRGSNGLPQTCTC